MDPRRRPTSSTPIYEGYTPPEPSSVASTPAHEGLSRKGTARKVKTKKNFNPYYHSERAKKTFWAADATITCQGICQQTRSYIHFSDIQRYNALHRDLNKRVYCQDCVPRQQIELHCAVCRRTRDKEYFSNAAKSQASPQNVVCRPCQEEINKKNRIRKDSTYATRHFEAKEVEEKDTTNTFFSPLDEESDDEDGKTTYLIDDSYGKEALQEMWWEEDEDED